MILEDETGVGDWYDEEENVRLTAAYLVGMNYSAAQVYQCFEEPWEYTSEFYEARQGLNSFLEEIEGL